MVIFGGLRHGATFYTQTEADDGEGGMLYTDVQLGQSRWAAIRTMTGRERTSNKTEEATTTHEIRIRYWSEVDSSLRVKVRGRWFEIEGVINVDERDREMVLLCKEAV